MLVRNMSIAQIPISFGVISRARIAKETTRTAFEITVCVMRYDAPRDILTAVNEFEVCLLKSHLVLYCWTVSLVP